MIPRRITEHVKAHNWFAVGIDFVIVVVGVFLGIQIGNWNSERSDRAEYGRALERLSVEIDTNLATLDSIDPDIEQMLVRVTTALDALQSCENTEANRKAVNIGLNQLRATYGLHLRTSALVELATSPSLLAQQTAAERQRFTDLLYYYDLAQKDAEYSEHYPSEGRFENNPIIGLGAPQKLTQTYFGVDYSKVVRPLFLKVPIDAACQNDSLVKAFYNWERLQTNIPILTRKVRGELEATKALIEART